MQSMHKWRIMGVLGIVSVLLTILVLALPASGADLDKQNKLTPDELIAGAKREGKLTFYSALPQFSNEDLIKKFTETYPFVKAEVVRAGGLVIAQRFAAEKAKNIENMDVIYSGAAEVYPDWAKRGHIARVDNLPEWEHLIDVARGPTGRYVAFGFASQVMAWNRKIYKDDQVPADLWEFTKPGWKNKVASGDPAGAGFALNWFSFASDVRPKDPRSTANPSGLGFKWMAAMSQNGLLLAGQVGNLTEAIVSGRRPIVIQHWDAEIVEANKRGADLGWRYPVQGTVAQHVLGAINSRAPHPHTARLFLNWLLSGDGQAIVVTNVALNTVRADMKTSDFIKGRRPISECWILDIERITPEETREFIVKLNDALRGKAR